MVCLFVHSCGYMCVLCVYICICTCADVRVYVYVQICVDVCWRQ